MWILQSHKSYIKQPTSFKNPEKPSCIDLILTNRPKSLQSTCVVEIWLSNFQRVTIFVLKMHFQKLPPRLFSYRNFSNYRNANFINSLNEVLPEEENMESLSKDPNSLCEKVLNQHVLYKKVYLRGNNKTFMNKECKKNVCVRSFSGPNFPAFGLNMEIYFVNLRKWISVFSPNAGKYELEKLRIRTLLMRWRFYLKFKC